MDNPQASSLNSSALRAAMTRRMHRRAVANGQIRLPAVPGMLDEYVKMCHTIFSGLGVHFTADELAHLRDVLDEQLTAAYAGSQRSEIVISYEAPIGTTLNYHINAEWHTVEHAYEHWITTRKPPLFGSQPDARVWTLAGAAPDPKGCRVLDIGARTGRNTLALARRGHPVDAVEIMPSFAENIRVDAARETLDVRVIESDVFEVGAELRWDYQLIVLSEVVSDFRTIRQLRAVFELAAQRLAPGGQLVFNAFLDRNGYIPDETARQLGQQCCTTIFTHSEMRNAAAGLSLELISDEAVYDYERTQLPEGVWPQTSWYAEWVSGLDVFDVAPEESPIEMRWLVYQKAGW